MEMTHSHLREEAEHLYSSLNVDNAFPELKGMSLNFTRTLLLARDIKINICKRCIASFLSGTGWIVQ